MGLLKRDPLKELLEDYNSEEYEDVLKQARAISRNDSEVVKRVEYLLRDPKKYLKENAKRFDERGIDIGDNKIADEYEISDLLFLAMVNELEEHGYSIEVDFMCKPEEFLEALERLKTYDLIADVIPKEKKEVLDIFTDEGDVDVWIEELNKVLEGKACVCYNDIDSDSYPLIIVTPEVFKELEGSDDDEPAERDAIGDYNLKINLAQTAADLLVQGEDYKELANTKCVFGYLYDIRDHGIEALYKLETDMTTAYFAAQGDKLMRLNFNEELFQTTVDGFLDAHKNDK